MNIQEACELVSDWQQENSQLRQQLQEQHKQVEKLKSILNQKRIGLLKEFAPLPTRAASNIAIPANSFAKPWSLMLQEKISRK